MDLVSQNLLMTSGGKKDSTYVDDVFSTYLYRGSKPATKSVGNGIKLSNANAGNSINFNNTGSIYVPATADFKFGTGAFTIEFFVYFGYSTNYIAVFDGRTNSSNNNNDRTVTGLLTNGQLNWWNLASNTAVIANSAATQLTANAWSHVAYVREGTGTNEAKLYINGSVVGTGTDNMDYSVNQPVRIGGHAWSPGIFYGSFSNYRVVKGTAVYTSNFTPPTKALTNISGTVLLCFQSNTDPFAAAVSPAGTWTNGTGTMPIAESFGPFTGDDGQGGLVWIKSRTNTYFHVLQDTERGTTKVLKSNSNEAEFNTSQYIGSFNNSGFSFKYDADNDVNNPNQDFSSWTFRKAPGFFDIVTYTGNASAWNSGSQVLNHSLGCVPGLIIIKSRNQGAGPPDRDFYVYHKDIPNGPLYLNLNNGKGGGSGGGYVGDPRYFNDPLNNPPTASTFQVGDNVSGGGSYGGPPGFGANENGQEYIAYLFAGGESTAATARSVVFDVGNATALTTAHSSDFDFGSGDFTVEAWIKPTNASQTDPTVVSVWNFPDGRRSWGIFGDTAGSATAFDGTIRAAVSPDGQFATRTEISGTVNLHQWNHVAFTRSGNTLYFFINGVSQGTASYTGSVYSNTSDGIMIGGMGDDAPDIRNAWDGSISNVRVIKGTAVYTSSFRPPTEPLTNITNTKLLCCNNSSTTGSTVTPGTITAHNGPTASTDSPFDDPEGYIFGEEGDQNIIKCGSYSGTGSAGLEVNLGWEPQYLMVKRTSGSSSWAVFDSMRGIVTGGNDHYLYPDLTDAETTHVDRIDLTSTGFKITATTNMVNGSGENYVFLALRRPDGYVGKPAEAGTDAFAMDTGSNSSIIPNFDSYFPVDFALLKTPASSGDWYTGARLHGGRYLQTNSSSADANWGGGYDWDSNVGWLTTAAVSAWQSWMWKRHAGFDVVTFDGDGVVGRQVIHSLNKPIEMIWIKSRSFGSSWQIGHKGLNGGTNPWEYSLSFDDTAEASFNGWNNTAPTSTSISLGSTGKVNGSGKTYIMMLFASVDGISKVGSYDGSSSTVTVTTGFQPRFLIVKRVNTTSDWRVFDTTRGWGAGNDEYLNIATTAAQGSYQFGAPTSTGFTMVSDDATTNSNGNKYIYYAHA